MEKKTENKIKKEMRKYQPNEFKIYVDDVGWEDWMNEYTDAEDGEPINEDDNRKIEKIQKELWDEVHN
jgi:hypothetical protein